MKFMQMLPAELLEYLHKDHNEEYLLSKIRLFWILSLNGLMLIPLDSYLLETIEITKWASVPLSQSQDHLISLFLKTIFLLQKHNPNVTLASQVSLKSQIWLLAKQHLLGQPVSLVIPASSVPDIYWLFALKYQLFRQKEYDQLAGLLL